jgi:glutamyl-tRNA synthetase
VLTERAEATTARTLLAAAHATLGICGFDESGLEAALRALASALNCTTGQLFGVIRAAVTGRKGAPPLFAVLALLGRERVLARISRAIAALLSDKPAAEDAS